MLVIAYLPAFGGPRASWRSPRAALTVHTAAHLNLGGLDAAATAALAADCGMTAASGEVPAVVAGADRRQPAVRPGAGPADGGRRTRGGVGIGAGRGPRCAAAQAWPGCPARPSPRCVRPPCWAGDIDVDLLAELGRSDPDDLLDALEPAVLLGLLDEPEPGRLRFAHALVRDTLYEDTSKLRRSRLHAAALELLRAPGRSVDPAALAHHAVAAATAETSLAAAAFATDAAREAGFGRCPRRSRPAVARRRADAGACGRPQAASPSSTVWRARPPRPVRADLRAGSSPATPSRARIEMKAALQLLTGKSRDDLTVRVLTAWDTPVGVAGPRIRRIRQPDDRAAAPGAGRRRNGSGGRNAGGRPDPAAQGAVRGTGGHRPGRCAGHQHRNCSSWRDGPTPRTRDRRAGCCAPHSTSGPTARWGPTWMPKRDSTAAELLRTAEVTEQADYQAVAHWLLSLAAGHRSDLVTAKRHVDVAVARAGTGQLRPSARRAGPVPGPDVPAGGGVWRRRSAPTPTWRRGWWRTAPPTGPSWRWWAG